MRRLNLGCGPYSREGFINIDKNPRQTNADLIRDVRKGLPYDDSSVDEIWASHFFEHLTCEELLDVMEECYRVMRAGTLLTIIVPLMEFATIDHKLFLSEGSFDILARDGDHYFNRAFKWEIASKNVAPERGYDILTIVFRAMK